jgi:putative PEP-CTERM system TPR-repeat lipoprotein
MAALADLALVQGKADEATTWLEKASNENPDAVAPALRLGNQYLATRQPRKALTLARKFQTQNPTNADLLDLLGQAQLASEDAEGALETYSKLVNVLPKSGQAQLRLAAVHRTLKNDDAAAADLRRAIELQPELVPARVAQAQLALARGKPDDAIATARALQKQSGANATAGYLLEGDVQLAQKQPAAALPLFQKAYAASKSPQVAIKLAEAYKLAGKAPDADALLAQWQKEHPDDQAVPLYLAERLLADGQYKPAIGALEALVKRNPNNAIALNNLAWAYQQDKNPRALETAERAYGLAAGNPAVLDTLGWMLVEQGKLARALPLLQQAASLTGEPAIRYHLAVALEKSGDKENARKTLQELLAKGARFPDAQAARALLQQLG